MAALHRHPHHHHHIKAPAPTWFLVKATPPLPRDAAKKTAAPSHSPLLLSPSVWQKAPPPDDEKKSTAGGDSSRDHPGLNGGGAPASPRITCMGQVKGRRRKRCSAAAGGSEHAGGKLAGLVARLFGRRKERRASSSRACSKVRDVPSGSSSSGSDRGGGGAATAARVFDPPLPLVRRPARDPDAPSLWERRRGGGKALEGLRLTSDARSRQS